MPFDLSSYSKREEETPTNLFLSFQPFESMNLDLYDIDMFYAVQVSKIYLDFVDRFSYHFPEIKEIENETHEYEFKINSSSLEERAKKISSIYNPNSWEFLQFAACCPSEGSPLEIELKLAQKVGIENRRLFLFDFRLLDFFGCEYDKKVEENRRNLYSRRFQSATYYNPFKDLKL